jgi:triacylglycerol lipase
MATIVLAHGIFGFGNLTGGFSPVNYFNGVAAHLRRQGHTVIAPQVNPIGSVPARGEQPPTSRRSSTGSWNGTPAPSTT